MYRRSDRGTVTVLIVGFIVVVGLLTAVVVDASAAYLRRQSLMALADGSALAAADGVEWEQVYTTGLGEQAVVDPQVAHDFVADYLRTTGAFAEHPGLSWRVSTDGTVVTVRVAAPLDLPITPSGWAGATIVSGTASAVVEVE